MSHKQNQPHSLYTFPNKLAMIIYEKLGTAEGFVNFQHKLQFAENIMDLIELLGEFETQNQCVNIFTGKPITVKLDRVIMQRMKQIWYRGGYLLINYIVQNDEKFIQWTDYKFEYPEHDTSTQDVEQMPSLISLKAKDEVSSEKPLLRIGQKLPDRVVYKGQDPHWLTETAELKYTVGDKYYPYFESAQDILKSEHWTKDVPRDYYDDTASIAYHFWYQHAIVFRVNAWRMAKQMESIEFGLDSDDGAKSGKYSDVTKLE